jgi:hypothetical protein
LAPDEPITQSIFPDVLAPPDLTMAAPEATIKETSPVMTASLVMQMGVLTAAPTDMTATTTELVPTEPPAAPTLPFPVSVERPAAQPSTEPPLVTASMPAAEADDDVANNSTVNLSPGQLIQILGRHPFIPPLTKKTIQHNGETLTVAVHGIYPRIHEHDHKIYNYMEQTSSSTIIDDDSGKSRTPPPPSERNPVAIFHSEVSPIVRIRDLPPPWTYLNPLGIFPYSSTSATTHVPPSFSSNSVAQEDFVDNTSNLSFPSPAMPVMTNSIYVNKNIGESYTTLVGLGGTDTTLTKTSGIQLARNSKLKQNYLLYLNFKTNTI